MGALAHLMTETVTIADESGRSNYGDPTFGAQSSIDAKVFFLDSTIIGVDGNEYRSTAKFATETEVTYLHRVWLPGDSTGDNTAARRPLMIKTATNPRGDIEFWEVFL